MGTLSFDKTSESPVVDLGFPIGGVDLFGGVDLRRGHFLVKIYGKTKELGPVVGGGGVCRACQPRYANEVHSNTSAKDRIIISLNLLL